MKQSILIDIDGVIANFYKGFSEFLNKEYGCTLRPDVEPSQYDFGQWGHGVQNINFDLATYDWMVNDGFEKLEPFNGAQNFIKKIKSKYEIYFVTARIGDWETKLSNRIKNKIKNNTYAWLSKHNMPTDCLHFAHDKIPFCLENKINLMVEDKLSTAVLAAQNNITTILLDRGYNKGKEYKNVLRVFSFDEALKILM